MRWLLIGLTSGFLRMNERMLFAMTAWTGSWDCEVARIYDEEAGINVFFSFGTIITVVNGKPRVPRSRSPTPGHPCKAS